jgi:hypothetical protein
MKPSYGWSSRGSRTTEGYGKMFERKTLTAGTALLASGLLALGVAPAFAATATAPAPAAPLSKCTAEDGSQLFTAFKDYKFYVLAPGGDFEDASGWELTRGANVTQAIQPDGSVGGVLDLPSKAQATSPVMCITSDYPIARLWVRNLAGSEGVFFYVSYLKNGVWAKPKNTGQFHGDKQAWRLSNPMNVQPSNSPGWQQVRFTFVAGGTKSRFQVNDFWVDPRRRI